MSNPKVFQVPATLDGLSTLKDGGMSVRFHTQEIDSNDKVALMGFQGAFGWLQFSDQTINEVPKETIQKDITTKTPSQRLRATLFVAYQQSGRLDITFEQYYNQKMEAFIERVKSTLE